MRKFLFFIDPIFINQLQQNKDNKMIFSSILSIKMAENNL
jgi:hypothetical protein